MTLSGTDSVQHRSTFTDFLERQGIARPIAWGFVALTLGMVGDGFELGFLSPFLESRGIGASNVATLFTAYGVMVAIAAWLSGALAEAIGPRRVMLIGFGIWIVLHAVFLLGVATNNYTIMLIAYGIRGAGYPMYAYGFLVLVTGVTPEERLGRAVGWFWFFNVAGIGVISAYLAGLLIPLVGELGTLWISLVFVAAGGLITMFTMRQASATMETSGKPELRKMLRGLSIVRSHPKVAIGGVVRVINTLSFYAFGVFMTAHMVREVGFDTPTWQFIWGTMLLANVLGNIAFGYLGDKLGRVNVVAWFGGIGCAITAPAMYYVPHWFGPNVPAVLVVSVLYGLAVAAFVPLSAIMPMLAPAQKASAVAILNLGAGVSNFAGPFVTRLFLGPLGVAGLVWLFAGIYVLGAVLTYLLRTPRIVETSETESAAVAST